MTKSVIITGVNGGIGKALSVAFSDNGYTTIGLDIVHNDFNCDYFIPIDLNRFASETKYRIEKSQKILEFSSKLEVLINNAATQILGNLPEITADDWLRSLNINLNSAFFLSQLCLDSLKENNGSIINIASIHAAQTKKRFLAYATSKAALEGMTRAMAVDTQGAIRVNAISPAAIETEMLKDGFKGKEELLNKLKSFHPSQKIGSPEEVARLALFLADERNAFLNGSVISLDGAISSVLHDPD